MNLLRFGFDGFGLHVSDLVPWDSNVGNDSIELLFLAFAGLSEAGDTDTETHWDVVDTVDPECLVEGSIKTDFLFWDSHVECSELADDLDCTWSTLLCTAIEKRGMRFVWGGIMG